MGFDEYFQQRYVDRLKLETDTDGSAMLSPKTAFDAVCDLCGAISVPLSSHDAFDIELFPGHWSKGSWAGCDECTAFIRNDDKSGLLEHSIIVYSKMIPEVVAREMVTSSHEKFWKAKK